LGEATLTMRCNGSKKPRLQLLPANGDLTAAEVNLLETENAPGRLRAALASVEWNFDIIMIDCPPSLNMLTVNALTAAQSVIIPVQCEYYALEGLSALLDTIEKVRKSTNPGLRIEGVVRTMFDPRNRLANDVSAQIAGAFRRGGVRDAGSAQRATWRKRPATACRSSITTTARAARKATGNWPGKCGNGCGGRRRK
jgi:chromosome partitioning protein